MISYSSLFRNLGKEHLKSYVGHRRLYSHFWKSTRWTSQQIDQLFNKHLSKYIYSRNHLDVEDDFLIINDPDITMRHPLIGIDIQAEAQTILDSMKDPCYRFKHVFYLIASMGQGKTRMLVELDKELKKHPNVCSIAITFDHRWSTYSRHMPDNAIKDTGQKYSSAIISRMISVHYRMPFSLSMRLADELVLEVGSDAPTETMIGGCVRFIINQMRQGNNNIDHFVLLIDESVKLAFELNVPGVYTTIQNALLSTQLMNADESPLWVDLVISSRNLQPVIKDITSRIHIPITLSTHLDSRAVLRDWVKVRVPDLTFQSARDELKMLLFIECLSPVPRTLQLMVTVLEDMKTHTEFDSVKMKQLYDGTMVAINHIFPSKRIVSAKYGMSLLFNDLLEIDDTLRTLVEDGIFVNSLSPRERYTVLETSIASMKRLSTNTEIAYPSVVVNTIESLLDNLTNPINTDDTKMPLCIIMQGLINARLQVLLDLCRSNGESNQRVFLWSLLRIKFNSEEPLVENPLPPNISLPLPKRWILYILECDRVIKASAWGSTKQLPLSDMDKSARYFLSAANLVTQEQGSFVHIKLHPNECADGLWMFPKSRDSIPFLLAVDCTSRHFDSTSAQDTADTGHSFYELPGQGSQALRFFNLVKEAMAWPVADVRDGSMLDALRSGNFLYVYINPKANSTVAVGDHILHMGQEDSSRFLSFFNSYFCLYKSWLDDLTFDNMMMTERSKITTDVDK